MSFIKELKEEAKKGFGLGTYINEYGYIHRIPNRDKIFEFCDFHITRTALRTLEEVKREVEKMIHKHDTRDEVSKYHFMSVGKNETIAKILKSLSHLQEEIKKSQ